MMCLFKARFLIQLCEEKSVHTIERISIEKGNVRKVSSVKS